LEVVDPTLQHWTTTTAAQLEKQKNRQLLKEKRTGIFGENTVFSSSGCCYSVTLLNNNFSRAGSGFRKKNTAYIGKQTKTKAETAGINLSPGQRRKP
jgi:hypothetical protein